jgi:hypothetical protein
MSLAASFLPSLAFALRASRVAALPLLSHAAAQAGCFERLSGQFIMFVRCHLHKVLHAISPSTPASWRMMSWMVFIVVLIDIRSPNRYIFPAANQAWLAGSSLYHQTVVTPPTVYQTHSREALEGSPPAGWHPALYQRSDSLPQQTFPTTLQSPASLGHHTCRSIPVWRLLVSPVRCGSTLSCRMRYGRSVRRGLNPGRPLLPVGLGKPLHPEGR